MPRITSPTVAEHRQAQLARLLQDAQSLVTERGAGALTLAALAKRTGLSRPTLYGYFSSHDDLVASICEQAVAESVAAITRAMRAEHDADRRLRVFVELHLAPPIDERQSAAMALAEAGLSTAAHERVMAAHEPLRRALHETLLSTGVPAPARAAVLVQGAVTAARAQIRAGADPGPLITDTISFVTGGLKGLGGALQLSVSPPE